MVNISEEKIYFKNSSGELIAGLLALPEGKGPFPAVVACHGFRTSKDGSKLTRLSKSLPAEGIALLRFDFSGLGESEGDFYDTTIGKNVDELEHAFEFVKKDRRIGSSRIGVLGSSMGGMVAIIMCAKNHDVSALGLMAPVTLFEFDKHYTEDELSLAEEKGFLLTESVSTGRQYKLNYAFITEAKTYDLMSLGEQIRCPVLIVNGTKDKSCPIENSKRFFEKLGCEKRFVEIPGCTHRFERPEDITTLISSVTRFFASTFCR